MRSLGLLAVLFLGVSSAKAAAVSPTFSTGTVTSRTETTTTVNEIIKQVDFTTGTSYTVTGTNIVIPDRPGPDSDYTIYAQGGVFQFSETLLGPGISRETYIERNTVIESVTDSMSVFSQ